MQFTFIKFYTEFRLPCQQCLPGFYPHFQPLPADNDGAEKFHIHIGIGQESLVIAFFGKSQQVVEHLLIELQFFA